MVVESSSYHDSDFKMAPPEVHHLFHHPIADHSFSADRQTLAVARDTSVELYGRSGNGFKLLDELKGHDKTVTSVDIAPNSGRIVTCSQGTQPLLLQDGLAGHGQTVSSAVVRNIWLISYIRPQCSCLGAFPNRLQTNPRSSPYKSRSHFRTLVSV